MRDNISGIIAAVLSTGFAAVLWVVFKGRDLWRTGAQASEAKTLRNLERWAEREQDRAERCLDLLDYWRTRSAELEYIVITQLGYDKLPARRPLPPDPDKEPRAAVVELEGGKNAGNQTPQSR